MHRAITAKPQSQRERLWAEYVSNQAYMRIGTREPRLRPKGHK